MKEKLGICLLGIALFFNTLAYADYWDELKCEAQQQAYIKLLKKEDICDVCGKIGKSSKMYRVIRYEQAYYDGEFVRVHKNCMTMNYFVIEAPKGESDSFCDWMNNQIRMERVEIAKLFPFLDILDVLTNFTANINFYKVKHKKNKKIYEIYKYSGEWKAREKQTDGKYKFWEDIEW